MKEILIQDNIKTEFLLPLDGKRQPEGTETSFFDTLKGAIGDVSKLQDEADQAILELSSGENRDIHNTMIAMEKAGISFQLMMQVRNKIINAYETIMRMNI